MTNEEFQNLCIGDLVYANIPQGTYPIKINDLIKDDKGVIITRLKRKDITHPLMITAKNISGIPITCDWLVKRGFKAKDNEPLFITITTAKLKEPGIKTYRIRLNKTKVINRFNKDISWDLSIFRYINECSEYDAKLDMYISYIHELQEALRMFKLDNEYIEKLIGDTNQL